MPDEDLKVIQAGAVCIGGRAVLIFGAPGRGKSTLALALIDRGGMLIGDDGVSLSVVDGRLHASPPPNIAGKLEIRGVGIVELQASSAPVALMLDLDRSPERLPETIGKRELLGHSVPCLPFDALAPEAALRAEWALKLHGQVMGR